MTPWLHLPSPSAALQLCWAPDHNILAPAAAVSLLSVLRLFSECWDSIRSSGPEQWLQTGTSHCPRAGWLLCVTPGVRTQLNQSAINNAAHTGPSQAAAGQWALICSFGADTKTSRTQDQGERGWGEARAKQRWREWADTGGQGGSQIMVRSADNDNTSPGLASDKLVSTNTSPSLMPVSHHSGASPGVGIFRLYHPSLPPSLLRLTQTWLRPDKTGNPHTSHRTSADCYL